MWKSSKEVKAKYNNLYKDETLIENITAAAFPLLNDASDKSFSNMYIYTHWSNEGKSCHGMSWNIGKISVIRYGTDRQIYKSYTYQ